MLISMLMPCFSFLRKTSYGYRKKHGQVISSVCVCVCVNTICALYVSIHVATLVLSGDLDRGKDVIDIT